MDLFELIEEGGQMTSELQFLSGLVDADAALAVMVDAGFSVNLGLGMHLRNSSAVPFITGVRHPTATYLNTWTGVLT